MDNASIDKFLYHDNPNNKRWDIFQNSDFLNIIYISGTFGRFFKFYIDKFSLLTPEINYDPFNDMGAVDIEDDEKIYSNKVLSYHASFINDNAEKTDLPICLIAPTTEFGFLFLKISHWFRVVGGPKNLPDHLWNGEKKFNEEMKQTVIESMIKLYKIRDTNKLIPKHIVRDWYKLEFLDYTKSDQVKMFHAFKEHKFFKKQKTFIFKLESFFNFDDFITNLQELDQFHNLKIDFNKKKDMKTIFQKGFNLDKIRVQIKEVKNIISAIEEKRIIDIPDLDVSQEGFIYAYLEKQNDFIQMPLCKHFFKTTKDIFDYIDLYPEHYKAMNPNLPTFNGIPNPFHLAKLKK